MTRFPRGPRLRTAIGAALVLAASACTTLDTADITGTAAPLELRQIQTRHYDTLDKRMTLRSVISTLQDLGFTIDRANLELGTITATRHDAYTMRITVTVRQQSDTQVAVRANARIGEHPVDDARTYQDFFVVLDKAMFLTLHSVD